MAGATNYEDGTDFENVYIIKKNKNKIDQNLTENKPVNNYTETEKIVHRFERHMHEIRLVIETFDLIYSDGNEIKNNNCGNP